jgi:hypothetical protein
VDVDGQSRSIPLDTITRAVVQIELNRPLEADELAAEDAAEDEEEEEEED